MTRLDAGRVRVTLTSSQKVGFFSSSTCRDIGAGDQPDLYKSPTQVQRLKQCRLIRVDTRKSQLQR